MEGSKPEKLYIFVSILVLMEFYLKELIVATNFLIRIDVSILVLMEFYLKVVKSKKEYIEEY